MTINIRTPEEIKIMAEGGKILANIMKKLEKMAEPGIATKELDRVAETLILKSGGKCSFKGYRGYPNCLCVSINEEIVHALPSDRKLKSGDMISLDLGIKYKGFHTDMAITILMPVSQSSSYDANVGREKEKRKLIQVTKGALEIGLKKAKPGSTFGDIGNAIQKYVESYGFNVVRELCGHGIGNDLHEDPEIVNYGERGAGPKIKEGMVFCLEPMVTAGDWQIKRAKDGYGLETKDGSLSCHFEHTIAVTKTGCRVLTKM